eukprot:COSAG06_NODE_155_length_21876_cov_22.287643_2_plen_115_part_00
MQIGEIEELEEYVQSVDLIDVVDDPPSASAQPEPAPGPADGQQCKQCYDRSHEGRIDASDGAHALPTFRLVSAQLTLTHKAIRSSLLLVQRLPPPERVNRLHLTGVAACLCSRR